MNTTHTRAPLTLAFATNDAWYFLLLPLFTASMLAQDNWLIYGALFMPMVGVSAAMVAPTYYRSFGFGYAAWKRHSILKVVSALIIYIPVIVIAVAFNWSGTWTGIVGLILGAISAAFVCKPARYYNYRWGDSLLDEHDLSPDELEEDKYRAYEEQQQAATQSAYELVLRPMVTNVYRIPLVVIACMFAVLACWELILVGILGEAPGAGLDKWGAWAVVWILIMGLPLAVDELGTSLNTWVTFGGKREQWAKAHRRWSLAPVVTGSAIWAGCLALERFYLSEEYSRLSVMIGAIYFVVGFVYAPAIMTVLRIFPHWRWLAYVSLILVVFLVCALWFVLGAWVGQMFAVALYALWWLRACNLSTSMPVHSFS